MESQRTKTNFYQPIKTAAQGALQKLSLQNVQLNYTTT